MTICVVSTGWNCAPFIDETLCSIAKQSCSDWRAVIVDDASDDARQREVLGGWAKAACDDEQCRFVFNPARLGAVRSQWEAAKRLDPADDDIIVWVDLDGDRLADPGVFDRVNAVYAGGDVLVAYGSYRTASGQPGYARPYPAGVIGPGLRQWTLRNGPYWNHLRTMTGRVFNAIPPDQCRWSSNARHRAGDWYTRGADYVFMTAALELAGEDRVRHMPEINLIYNDRNPLADNLTGPDETNRCVVDFLRRPALDPLP